MRRLAGHVLEVLTGYQRGGEALALSGEPRPQYAPGTAKLRRCEAKTAELGVSVMTVRRMMWRFEADGPAGLTDRRRQRAELRGVISSKPGLNRYLRATPGDLLRTDTASAKAEENLDGKYLPPTADPKLSAEDIAVGCKQLLEVERGWRDMKQVIDLRPGRPGPSCAASSTASTSAPSPAPPAPSSSEPSTPEHSAASSKPCKSTLRHASTS